MPMAVFAQTVRVLVFMDCSAIVSRLAFERRDMRRKRGKSANFLGQLFVSFGGRFVYRSLLLAGAIQEPETNRGLGRKPIGVRREKNLPDGFSQATNGDEFLLIAHVPKAKGAVVADGRERLGIGRESQPSYALSMAFADAEELSIFGAP